MISFRRIGRGWLAAIAILITILLNAPALVFGQEDGTPTPTGSLTVHSYQCQLPEQSPGAVLLQLHGDLGDTVCAPGQPVSLDLDGTQITVADGESTDLPAGEHVVTDRSSGAQLPITIEADTRVEIDAILVLAADPTEIPTEAPTETSVPTDTVVPTATTPPLHDQVTIVMHFCPATITSRTSFEALNGFGAEVITCPSIVMPGNNPAPGGITSGQKAFSLTVEGGDGVAQVLNTGMFDQVKECEADRPSDLNGNPNDNVCLDFSGYVVTGVVQGNPITIRPTGLPAGTIYVGRAFDPETDDGSTFVSAGSTGTLKLNTAADGAVTVHYFVAPQPPTATPKPPTNTPKPATATPKSPTRTPKPQTATPKAKTPTAEITATKSRTPVSTGTSAPGTSTPDSDGSTVTPVPTRTPGGPTGSAQFFVRDCFADEGWAQIKVFEPGAQPGQWDYGDATCSSGAGSLTVTSADGVLTQEVPVPQIGAARIANLPNGTYTVRDADTSQSGTFVIAANTTTNVISLNYQSDSLVEDPAFVPGPGDVDDPTELPADGVDPNYTPVDEDAVPNFGPEAGPGGGNPFVVDDDPEAVANVAAIMAYDDLPGVGTGPTDQESTGFNWGLFALAAVAIGLAIGGVVLRRRRDNDDL